MKTLFHRVSIRKYQNRPVEREHIIEILRAGMQAPSATNQPPWEFYVVEDRAMIKALSESSPYAGCVACAPVVIVAAYRTDCRVPVYAHIDMSIAMENIWLATDALGLGGVWIGTAPLEERMEAVEKIVGIPHDQRAFAVFPLGYPAEAKDQQNRFDESRIHWIDAK